MLVCPREGESEHDALMQWKNWSVETTVWLIFTLVFLVMMLVEARMWRKGLYVEEHDHGFSDMNRAQEILRSAVIKADGRTHKSAAISYALATLTAAASLVVTLLWD